MQVEKPAPPKEDRRWRVVEKTMRSHGYESHALIQVLHTVQETYGYLDKDAMARVAESLRVPLSRVYGVATFYHFFTLKPQGEHTCVVCTGTACYIKGAQDLLDAVEEVAGIKPGETSEDGKVSLLTARCLGSCGLAPAVVLDGEMTGKLGAEELKNIVRGWISEGDTGKDADAGDDTPDIREVSA